MEDSKDRVVETVSGVGLNFLSRGITGWVELSFSVDEETMTVCSSAPAWVVIVTGFAENVLVPNTVTWPRGVAWEEVDLGEEICTTGGDVDCAGFVCFATGGGVLSCAEVLKGTGVVRAAAGDVDVLVGRLEVR